MADEITIIIAIIGVIIGSISLIRQFWKERVKFIFEIKNSFWYPPEEHNNSKWYTIAIEILVRNTGQRSTTIHNVSISFSYKDKPYLLKSDQKIVLDSGHAESPRFNFAIHKKDIEIDKNPTNVKLEIEHTYKKKQKIISEISKLK